MQRPKSAAARPSSPRRGTRLDLASVVRSAPGRFGRVRFGGVSEDRNQALTWEDWLVESREARKAELIESVRVDGRALYEAEKEFKSEREVVLAAVQQFGRALGFASVACRGDQAIVLAAVQQDGFALESATPVALQHDDDLLSAAVAQKVESLRSSDETAEGVLKGLKTCDCEALTQNRRAIVLAAVEQDGQALRYADKEMSEDREIVLCACRQHGWALAYAPLAFRADREIVLAAVRSYGCTLRLFEDEEAHSTHLGKDREIVLEAVRQDRFALDYADKLLQNDPEIKLAARLQEKSYEQNE